MHPERRRTVDLLLEEGVDRRYVTRVKQALMLAARKIGILHDIVLVDRVSRTLSAAVMATIKQAAVFGAAHGMQDGLDARMLSKLLKTRISDPNDWCWHPFLIVRQPLAVNFLGKVTDVIGWAQPLQNAVVTTAPLESENLDENAHALALAAVQQFGRLLGAPNSDRVRNVNKTDLGTYCTNFCMMQFCEEVDEWLAACDGDIRNRSLPFCSDCITDIRATIATPEPE